jgi:hypothetical protein
LIAQGDGGMTHFWLSMMAFLLVTGSAFSATYSISTNARAEGALDRATAAGGSHEGLTKVQVLQRFVNADLQSMFDQQNSGDSRELDRKLSVATNAAKNNARTALNAGIALPVVTDIPNQTNNVGQSPVIPIVATDPDGLSLRVTATGLPPGMAVSFTTQGTPQISGTLTTAGTYAVVIHAQKFSDIEGTDSFSWQVNP